MMLYPDTQRRAQEEIDGITGRNRLPDLSDRSKLPYLDCILKEVLRWQPAAPIGKYYRCELVNILYLIASLVFPHVMESDCNLHSMHIPKGTTVIVNLWYVSYHTFPTFVYDFRSRYR